MTLNGIQMIDSFANQSFNTISDVLTIFGQTFVYF